MMRGGMTWGSTVTMFTCAVGPDHDTKGETKTTWDAFWLSSPAQIVGEQPDSAVIDSGAQQHSFVESFWQHSAAVAGPKKQARSNPTKTYVLSRDLICQFS
jgi:hypothetical protein